MLPGFEYTPQTPNYFRAYIDPNAPSVLPIVYGTPVDPENRPIDTNFTVGTTPGQAGVSLTGGATYTLPIFSSPGTAGMQPSLSLVYNSQSGNGIAGYGWNIAGLSAITRMGHTIYHNGAVKGVDFIDDRFALDGQRLLLGAGIYGAEGSSYYTEVFNGSKIYSHDTTGSGPEWFEVIGKDGSIIEYGREENARLTSQRSDQSTITWYINKITDPNGNYMSFFYNKKPLEINLKEIQYTGNKSTNPQITPYNSIRFYYSERTDTSNAYIAGSRMEQTVLLDHIDIVAEKEIIKTYKLKYYYNSYSKLNEVEEYGRDNKRYNSTVFGYGDGPMQHYENLKSLYESGIHQNFFADFNGDGKTDIFKYYPESEIVYTGRWLVKTIKDNGNFNAPMDMGDTGDTVHGVSIGDYNGDGYSDVQIFEHYRKSSTIQRYLLRGLYSNGAKMIQDTIDLGSTYFKTKITSADFDGDNKDEILLLQQLDSQTLRARIYKITLANLGQHIFTKSIIFDKLLLSPIVSIDSADYHILDFDGDGKDEFLYHEQSSHLNKDRLVVYKFLLNPTNNYNIQYSEEKRFDGFKEKIFSGDFNGDGNSDILYRVNHRWYIGVSTGISLITNAIPHSILNVDPNDTLVQMTVQDFNQDGKTDIAFSVYNPTTYYLDIHLLTSTGTSFSENNWGWQLQDTLTLHALGNKSIFEPSETYPVDFNGDGNGDYVFEASFSYGQNYDFFYDHFYVSSINPGFNPLTIKKTCNGFNLRNTIKYKPLTNASIYTRSTTNTPDCMNIQPPQFAVSSFSTENGIGGINSKYYKYTGAIVNLTGKGFLGFKGNTIIDSLNKIISSSTFEPDPDYFILKPTQSITKTLSDTTLNKSIITNKFLDIENAPSKVIFPYLSKTISFDYFTKTRKVTTTDYDIYANLSSKIDTIYPSFDASAQAEFVNSITYSGFVNGMAWCPAKPSDIVQTMKREGEQVIATKKHITYGSQGNIMSFIDFYEQDSAVQTTYPEYIAGLAQSSRVHIVNRPSNTDDIVQQITYDDKYRFPLTITDALGFKTNATFDAGFGNKLTQTDANELTTTHNYDGFGTPRKVTDDAGVWVKNETHWFQNPGMANVLFYSQTNSNNRTPNRNYFDKLGRTLYTKNEYNDGSKAIIKMEYNQKGLITKVSEPYFENSTPSQYTITVYDEYNRPKTITMPSQDKLIYTYPNPKFPGRTTSVKDSITGITTYKTIDATGLLDSITDPGGSILFAYYSDGQLKSTTTPDGSITSITYDAYGRQTLLDDPDADTASYNYNALGQLQKQTDARGVTYKMFYDKAGRLIKQAGINLSGSQTTLTNTYYPPSASKGSRGLPAVELFVDETGNTVSHSYTYDDKVRLIQKDIVSSDRIFTYNYIYDALGNLKEYTYPSGYTLTYDYNENNGTLKKVIQKSDNKVIYEPGNFNTRGQLLNYKIANGSLFTSLEFDEYGMPTFIKSGKDVAGASEIQKLETNFNIFTGNLAYRKDYNYTLNGSALTEAFTYDDDFKNSLKTWQVDNQTQYSMSVDKTSGNIKSKSDFTSLNNNYIYNQSHPHAIDRVQDPIIVPAEEQQNTSYNLAGKIRKIEHIQQNKHLNINYGPLNERIKSTMYANGAVSKTKFFIGGDYEVEISPNGSERYLHYLPGGGLYISHPTPGFDSLNYVLTDYQGTWYKVITEAGATVEHYSFDPWGRRRNATDWTYTNVPTSFNFDRGYTGHQMLDAFGLINMNGRVYDPIVARFLSPDNFVQNPEFSHSYNRYSYCFNNPLKYTDPSGMQSIYHSNYNPWKPVSSGGGQSGPQVYIDGIRYDNIFGLTASINKGGGGGGLRNALDIESKQYAGDLTGYGINPADVIINGHIYSGVDNFAVRENLAKFGYFGPNTSIAWGDNAVCTNIYGTWKRDNNGNWSQTAGVDASNVVAQSGGGAQGGGGTSGDYLFNKTYMHFQTGGTEPMKVNASTLNIGNVRQKDLTYNPKTGQYSLDLYKKNPASEVSLALGKISLVNQGGNQFSVNPDYYDFNIEWQNGFSKRNVATAGAAILHYNATSLIFGGPFWINFQGTLTINR